MKKLIYFCFIILSFNSYANNSKVTFHSWDENSQKGKIGEYFKYENPYSNESEIFKLLKLGNNGKNTYFPTDRSDNDYWHYVDIKNFNHNNYPVIDVYVFYEEATNDENEWVKKYIYRSENYANKALENSLANFRIRVIGFKSLSQYNSENEIIINNFYDNSTDEYAWISKIKDDMGADLVAFVRFPGNGANSQHCGGAPIIFRNGIKDLDQVDAENGAQITIYKNQICDSQPKTFIHEIGHVLGLTHGARSNEFGVYTPDAMGYGVDGSFATIMSSAVFYNDAEEVPYFSNPRLKTECKGLPCGTQNANAIKTLNITGPLLSEVRTLNLTEDEISNNKQVLIEKNKKKKERLVKKVKEKQKEYDEISQSNEQYKEKYNLEQIWDELEYLKTKLGVVIRAIDEIKREPNLTIKQKKDLKELEQQFSDLNRNYETLSNFEKPYRDKENELFFIQVEIDKLMIEIEQIEHDIALLLGEI